MKKTFGVCLSLLAATLFMEMVCRAGEQQGTGMVYQAAGAGNLQFVDAPYGYEETAGVALTDLVQRKPVDGRLLKLNDRDMEILLRISAAEANTEDVIGKALVMRVVLNRMESPDFPDTIEGVVFQRRGGKYQFCPVMDGSYWDVEVTQECYDALSLVLAGWDASHGAEYFCTQQAAGNWHEGSLEYLFQHGNHKFYVGKGGDVKSERK